MRNIKNIFAVIDLQRMKSLLASNGFALEYDIIDLGTLDLGSNDSSSKDSPGSSASSINDLGQVVGKSFSVRTPSHAFLWDSVNGMIDLGDLGDVSNYAFASDINKHGQVVGGSNSIVDGKRHAFKWDSINKMQDLGTPGIFSVASAINNLGQVVSGNCFLWDSDNVMQNIGFEALDINDSGQVVGGSHDFDGGLLHAVLWDSGNGMKDLGILDGYTQSKASAINASGQVVGSSYYLDGSGEAVHQAFIWDSVNGMQGLGILGNSGCYPGSKANAINDLGQVVGDACGCSFIWDSVNGMRDLNSLIPADPGWSSLSPSSINNSGQIVGTGTTGSGEGHAFLLTPIVQPVEST